MKNLYWPQTALLHDHGDGAYPLGNILGELQKMSGLKVDPKQDYRQVYRERFSMSILILFMLSLT